MSRAAAVPLTALAGMLVALQAPINSRLGRGVGTFPAAVFSFGVGLLVLVLIALLASDGLGGLGRLSGAPWWALLGGLLGAAYVASVIVTVRTLGAGGVTAATIAGQLTMAVIVDQFGLLGVARHAIGAERVAGIVLLAAGVFLIVRS
ncbi:MAG: DMT family transporter [Solirubrobacteraceae bacterium]